MCGISKMTKACSFLEKRTKKLLPVGIRNSGAKVFCFFFSKKKTFFFLALVTPAASQAQTPDPAPPAPEDYAIHAQTTFTEQYHPAFAAAYTGPNSLDPGSRGDETWDVTLSAGLRVWHGAELWVTPEVDQGFGLSNTLGIAAFSSAEAYKVGESTPYVRIPRLFVRQTIDLGGATQTVAPDQTQLGGTQTANRVIFTIGKFGAGDMFDTNAYAHDPRNDFMNWAVVDSGAFDYAADAWGFTYGAALEWYQDWWTLRAGAFDGSVDPNSKFLETRIGAQFQLVTEAEARYSLFGEGGKVRLLGFQTRALLATLPELTSLYETNPAPPAADIAALRRLRNKFGGALNIEQQIMTDLGFFLRASLDDGRTEAYEFTDIDRSLATGLSLAGGRWGRPDDTAGLAAIVDNISEARKKFLEAGGLGILVGDGKLINAGPEQVLETYYSYSLHAGIEITADYQCVNNPGYNRDRGPVSILGARFHAQF
jgi:high affinity Mn2+ porin